MPSPAGRIAGCASKRAGPVVPLVDSAAHLVTELPLPKEVPGAVDRHQGPTHS
jgi:hypothetical protein